MRTSPCEWPLEGCDTPSLDTLTGDGGEPSPVGAAVIDAATSLLWSWTGRVFGLCDTTVRPCRRACAGSTYAGPVLGIGGWVPVLLDGRWRNVSCGVCLDGCRCEATSAVRLPGPVASVTEVKVDGEVVAPSGYRLERGLLIRNAPDRWPTCNDYDAPATEPGTWEVTYKRGLPVPPAGQLAAAVLAEQLAKAVCADGSCQLPQRVQTLTRQGVTVGILDPFDGVERGATGLWVVDSWVASVTNRPRRSTVTSPDVPRAVVR